MSKRNRRYDFLDDSTYAGTGDEISLESYCGVHEEFDCSNPDYCLEEEMARGVEREEERLANDMSQLDRPLRCPPGWMTVAATTEPTAPTTYYPKRRWRPEPKPEVLVEYQFPRNKRHDFFVYGILRSRETVSGLISPNPYDDWSFSRKTRTVPMQDRYVFRGPMEPATLPGWQRLNTGPAFIVPNPEMTTEGILIRGITNRQLLAFDQIEGIHKGSCNSYKRIRVTCYRAADGKDHEVWLYSANLERGDNWLKHLQEESRANTRTDNEPRYGIVTKKRDR